MQEKTQEHNKMEYTEMKIDELYGRARILRGRVEDERIAARAFGEEYAIPIRLHDGSYSRNLELGLLSFALRTIELEDDAEQVEGEARRLERLSTIPVLKKAVEWRLKGIAKRKLKGAA